MALWVLHKLPVLTYLTFTLRKKDAQTLSVAYLCAGGDPDQFWGALPLDVTTGRVSLDDAEDQTHGWAVGQRHPISGCQAEPGQAEEEEGGRGLFYTWEVMDSNEILFDFNHHN